MEKKVIENQLKFIETGSTSDEVIVEKPKNKRKWHSTLKRNEASQPPVIEDIQKANYGNSGNVLDLDSPYIMKSEKEFTYLVHHDKLTIVKTDDPKSTQVISNIKVRGQPQKLLIHQGNVVVYSYLEQINSTVMFKQKGKCHSRKNCRFQGDGYSFVITFIDVKNQHLPVISREIEFQASMLNFKKYGDNLYMAILFPEVNYKTKNWPVLSDLVQQRPAKVASSSPAYNWQQNPNINTSQLADDKKALRLWQQYVYNVKERFRNQIKLNRRTIENLDHKVLLPNYTSIRYTKNKNMSSIRSIGNCQDILFSKHNGSSLIGLMTVPMSGNSYLKQHLVLTQPSAVYIQEKPSKFPSVILASSVLQDTEERTIIHKFILDSSKNEGVYKGSGTVKGRLIHWDSLDVRHDFVRIGTQMGNRDDKNRYFRVTFLESDGHSLQYVAAAEHIGASTKILKLLFLQDTAIAYTSVSQDVSYILDLDNPFHPAVVAEWNIDLVNSKIKILDDQHVITYTSEQDINQEAGKFSRLNLRIWNFQDRTSPRLTHQATIPTLANSQQLTPSFLQIFHFPSYLVLTVKVCQSDQLEPLLSGAVVYRMEKQLNQLSVINHKSVLDSCHQDWEKSKSFVKGVLFLENYVLTLSQDQMLVTKMGDAEPKLKIGLE